MAKKLTVSEKMEMTFNRVLRRMPAGMRNDIELQKSILLFLKLGGERLARARIKPVVSPFPDDISVVKPRPLPTIVEPGLTSVADKDPVLAEKDESPEEQD